MAMKQVFVDELGFYLGVHDPEQRVATDAYASMGVDETGSVRPSREVRSFLLPESDVEQLVTIDRDTRQITRARLSSAFMANYVEPVPEKITSTQGKLWLLDEGRLEDVEATLAGMPDSPEKRAAQLKFDAANWFRADPMFDELGGALSPPMNAAAIDAGFRAALSF